MIREYFISTKSVLLTPEYIASKYKDILEFLMKNQPVKKPDLEREFKWRAKEFIIDAKAINIIKPTNKGYSLTSEGEALANSLVEVNAR